MKNIVMPNIVEDLGMIFVPRTSKYKRHYGIFKCPFCQSHFRASLANIKRGNVKSCGCFRKQTIRSMRLKHGFSRTPLYFIYRAAINRCYNPVNKGYKNYGARGIVVCEEWKNSFMAFRDWSLRNGYEPGLEIDRIDNDGPYSPENCRWVTSSVNGQNKRLIGPKNKSGFRGVCWDKKRNKWRANIKIMGKQIHLGRFPTPKLAAQAYNDFVIKNKTHHPLNILP